MKNAEALYLVASALVAVGATVGATRWLERPDGRAAAGVEAAASDGELARVEEVVAGLAARQAELEATLARLDASSPDAGATRRAEVDVEGAVAAWLEANASELASTAGAGTASATPGTAWTPEDALEVLQHEAWPDGDEAAFWQELRDEGRLDAVIVALEEAAERSPWDPDVHVDLATAYGQKAFDLGAGPMQAEYREKQDRAFDAALEVAPRHWDARFGKALGLSEWPTFLGKTSEAIHQLERLAKQQEASPKEPRFLQTYFFLGNLHLESGRPEKALAAWRRGLALFPGAPELEEQVAQLEAEERP